jgi:hypothetical protein
MVTVIDRFRALRIEPHKHVTWAVGDAVMQKYVKEYERQPPKVLRPKTNARGSHCFAFYPVDWIPVIDRIILTNSAEAQRQGDLF